MLPYVLLLVVSLGDLLSQPQTWALVLGLLAPALVEVVKQPGLPEKYVRPVAVGVAAVIGLLTVLAAGQFNTGDVLTTLALVIAASQAAYTRLWKPSGYGSRVQSATNLPYFKKRARAKDLRARIAAVRRRT